MARAAGLNIFANRLRKTYLLTTAIAEVHAPTYHGSNGLKIIATKNPVRKAPLGYCQVPATLRRIKKSMMPAVTIALRSPGATREIPSWGAARIVRISNTIVRSPLGVRRNLDMAELATSH